MNSLDRRIILILQQLANRYLRITLHEVVDGLYIIGGKDFLAHRLVDCPHDLTHVQVAVQLRTVVEIIHRIDAQQIKVKQSGTI